MYIHGVKLNTESPLSLPPPTHSSASELRRRVEREGRKERLTGQLQAMLSKDRLHQEQLSPHSDPITSELSVPWLILGFAVVVGYCIYYIWT